ncbi:PEP/pyruvate-binding domain-containing protein [Bdellovibrionota bacterium FG-1]
MKKFEYLQDKQLESFQNLIPHRVSTVLWVSSLYDSYLVEEEGRLHELVRREYQGLNLIDTPEVSHAASASEALEALSRTRYDLIIMTPHIKDVHVVRLAQMIREAGFEIPIVLLVFDNNERRNLKYNYDLSIFERIFIWMGDYRLIVAIIKSIEDRLNVENDTRTAGLQAIILIEDNVKFSSSYLPIIYTEVINQTQRLISEGANLTLKFLRMRTRPKILVCGNYEEAWAYYEKYSAYILGIISDMNFKHGGVKDPHAGLEFIKNVRAIHADIPALLQSSHEENATLAHEANTSFLYKGSPRLLHDLRDFIINNFGFGDFVFRTSDGVTVGRAENLKALEDMLKIVPVESIVFHAERNHFSNWLKARAEFSLAHRLRPRKAGDFDDAEGLREFLVAALREYRAMRTRGIITEFDRATFDRRSSFARIGGGSLGGKARGLGFVKNLCARHDMRSRFKGVEILVPSAVVVATDAFDQFMEANQLVNFALSATDDDEIIRRFLNAPLFPRDVIARLGEFLELVTEPLAVRSSSLLEDSQYQPFAGVYQTYMLPNNDGDPQVRLQELLDSIKRVYASIFFLRAKDYMRATEYRPEEEKMAVVIQRIVGTPHGCRYYPDFSGVAKSHNFYPTPPQKPTDGIAMVALGLGQMVVDGGNSVRFCPRYPRHLPQFSSARETMQNAQQDFFALNVSSDIPNATKSAQDKLVQRFDLLEAEKDGPLFYSGSTYSAANDIVYDGLSRSGQRIVTLAPVLKHDIFPLPEIINQILEIGSSGMGGPVEIEFAVNMSPNTEDCKEFGILQMRPMVLSGESEALDVESVKAGEVIVESMQILGNGSIPDIYDIVLVDPETFERSVSRQVAAEITQFNVKLVGEKRPYLLIGLGRWGSLDPWLGIPITWDQISGATAIVEAGFKDISVAPSQGSHFFQNITSLRVGYFTVSDMSESGFIDWEWLKHQPVVEEKTFSRHLRLDSPITARMNGLQGKGIILKPAAELSPETRDRMLR